MHKSKTEHNITQLEGTRAVAYVVAAGTSAAFELYGQSVLKEQRSFHLRDLTSIRLPLSAKTSVTSSNKKDKNKGYTSLLCDLFVSVHER